MPGKKKEEKDKGLARGAAAGAQSDKGRNPMYDEDLSRRDDQQHDSKRQPELGRSPGGYDEKQPGRHNRDQLGRRDD
jgi:hypothetical protein